MIRFAALPLVALALAAGVAHAQTTFPTFPLYQPDPIGYTDVRFVSPTVGYLSGTDETLAQIDNRGYGFAQTVPVPTAGATIYGLGGTAERFFYVTAGGGLYRSTDGRQTFTPQPSGVTTNLLAIDGTPGGELTVAVGDNRVLLVSTDGGTTWLDRTAQVPATWGSSYTVTVVSPSLAFVGNRNGILRTADGGATWTEATITGVPAVPNSRFNYRGIAFADRRTGFAVGEGALRDTPRRPTILLKTSDGGQTWRYLNRTEPTYADATDLDVTISGSDTVVTVVGGGASQGGLILRSTNAGATWTPQPAVVGNTLRALAHPTTDRFVSVGDAGNLISTPDGGGSWMIVSQPDIVSFTRVVPRHPFGSSYLAVGSQGAGFEVYATSGDVTGGVQPGFIPLYGTRAAQIDDAAFDLSSGSYGAGFAVGVHAIRRTTNSGFSWTTQLGDPFNALVRYYGVEMDGPDKAVVVGVTGNSSTKIADDVIVRTTDGGATWTTVSAKLVNRYLYDVLKLAPETWVAVGNDTTVVRSTDDGLAWSRVRLPVTTPKLGAVSLNQIARQPEDGRAWIVGDGGTLLHTTDGGATWARQPIVTAPGDTAKANLAAVAYAPALATSPASPPATLYVGGQAGFLASSTDDGRTWTLQQSNTTESIKSISIPHTSALGVFVTASGSIFEFGYLTGIGDERAAAPVQPRLTAVNPNPFNPTTTVRYQLPASGQVRVELFDVLGRRLRTLVEARQSSGAHTVALDGNGLPSGVYLVRLTVGTAVDSRRITLLR